MFTVEQMKSMASGLTTIATRAQTLIQSARKRIQEVSADRSRSNEWKAAQIKQAQEAPEVRSLLSQGKLAWASFEVELEAWRNPMMVLRSIAKPSAGDATREQRWGNCLAEANLMSNDPDGLQSLLNEAIHSHDWMMVYACLLGRVTRFGHPLNPGTAFTGTPLYVLELPGLEEVEAAAFEAEMAKLRLDSVAMEVRSWDGTPGEMKVRPDGSMGSLALDSKEAMALKKFEDGKAMRERIRRTPSSTDRWHIFLEMNPDAAEQWASDSQVKKA